jgi:putative transposase
MSVRQPYRGHRFPREIISYAVWFYFRFNVSFRRTEEAMAARGILVSYETIRRCCEKFGHLYAVGRGNGVSVPDKWHLDEVFLTINGVRHYLWRAVDQNGVVIDIWSNQNVTDSNRNGQAAELRGREARHHARCSSPAAPISQQPGRELAPADTRTRERERERRMRCFQSGRHAQCFVEVHGIIGSHFRPRRHLLSATRP